MRCYHRILRISYKDRVTNEEVRAKIQRAIGSHEDLLTMVKRRKLQWYGHVSRSSGLSKTILQGTVKGGRRPGRQRERWEDNIREWTGLEFAKSQRAMENGEKWRKLVLKSTVVPRRPSRLRDRWWWWWTVGTVSTEFFWQTTNVPAPSRHCCKVLFFFFSFFFSFHFLSSGGQQTESAPSHFCSILFRSQTCTESTGNWTAGVSDAAIVTRHTLLRCSACWPTLPP